MQLAHAWFKNDLHTFLSEITSNLLLCVLTYHAKYDRAYIRLPCAPFMPFSLLFYKFSLHAIVDHAYCCIIYLAISDKIYD